MNNAQINDEAKNKNRITKTTTLITAKATKQNEKKTTRITK